MSENAIQLYQERTGGVSRQKQYRVMALLAFCVAAGLTVIRLISYYLPIENEQAADAVFTVLTQICLLIVMPTLFYKFLLKKNFREMVEFSNIRKTKWYNLVLAVPIGFMCYIVTIAVSSIWGSLLISFGYNYPSSELPETFSAGLLVLEIVLTGVLPAFCEEYFNRGGLLTTLRGSFTMPVTILLMGLEFGLFHQYITQIFYTMLFGVMMAFLALKCKSALPCMIVHFMNNTLAVLSEYCYTYGFFGGGINGLITATAARFPMLVWFGFLVAGAVLAGLIVLLLYLNSANRLKKKKDVIASSGFDHTNNRVVLVGEEDKQMVHELDLDKEVYGETVKEELYKPTLKDNAFFIGAIVASLFITIATFIFGWIV